MAKASFKLNDGTNVSIEGTPEEVQLLLSHYSNRGGSPRHVLSPETSKPSVRKAKTEKSETKGESIDISTIINLVKTCDEAEMIETRVLDRTSFVDRTLLPLYIIHEHLGNKLGLTSGEINKITVDLGVPISTPNISTTLSGSAARYVVGDRIRKSGVPVRYKLSRRGVQYMKSVIAGKSDGK